jgi:hypothetical protein
MTARPRSALILDDETDRRICMREGLLDHGVRCDEASTLGEAIHRLTRASYELVVCDMVLCEPPQAANPAYRGYLAVCYALALAGPIVVQASAFRRWSHAGAILTNWSVTEVADVVYGFRGIPGHQSADGGCPWSALQQVAAAAPDRRRAEAVRLAGLPIVQELEGSLALGPRLAMLEDAAEGHADWYAAVDDLRHALFPGAGHGR